MGAQIRECLGNGSDFNLEIEYSDEPEPLETAGGIVQALPLLGQRFIVVNADIITNYDFSSLRQVDGNAHLVLVENPQHHPDGDFTLNDTKLGIEGSPRYTFSGISMYDRSFFDGLSPARQALAPLLFAAAAKQQVSGELFHGNWTDIGSLERLQALSG